MDFIRLATREVRRNSTRTGMAMTAMALAALILVLSRVLPDGYPTGALAPYRSFVGGDIVVFPAPSALDVTSKEPLKWAWWAGSDWQSHILYFFPQLEKSGYLIPEDAPPWRGFSPDDLVNALEGVPNVEGVEVYRTIPCLVGAPGYEFQAVLRGRKTHEGYPLGGLLADGREIQVGGEALAPGTPGSPFSLGEGITVKCPALRVVPGKGQGYDVDILWDRGVSKDLAVVGLYRVLVGEEDVYVPGSTERVTLPVYWERPEIVVDEETFDEIVKECFLGGEGLSDLPAYQVCVKVGRMSLAKGTVNDIRAVLGEGFAVYSVPDLVGIKASGSDLSLLSKDFRDVLITLTFALAACIVSGTIYILLNQQRRKIGLLRVVGATRKNVLLYALWMVGYVVMIGSLVGFGSGKLMSLLALLSSDARISEWAAQAAGDLLQTLALSTSLTIIFGTITGLWASRIPCAEVLKRE